MSSLEQPLKEALRRPEIALVGEINMDIYRNFRGQLDELTESDRPLVFALTTPGGDAEIARRIALDLELARETRPGYFLGQTNVYSAGVSIMASFPPEKRWLTKDCILLVHERRLEKELKLEGPIRGLLQRVRELQSQFELGLCLEEQVLRDLVEGTQFSVAECMEKARANWYVRAPEAVELGLVAGIV